LQYCDDIRPVKSLQNAAGLSYGRLKSLQYGWRPTARLEKHGEIGEYSSILINDFPTRTTTKQKLDSRAKIEATI
jgi:hypothetical protein